EEASLAHDRAHRLAVAAVDALALFEDHRADHGRLALLELGLDQLLVRQVLVGADLGGQRLGELLLEDRVALVAGLLVEDRSEEHTSELQSLAYLVCRL